MKHFLQIKKKGSKFLGIRVINRRMKNPFMSPVLFLLIFFLKLTEIGDLNIIGLYKKDTLINHAQLMY